MSDSPGPLGPYKLKTIDYSRDGITLTIPSYMEPWKDQIIDWAFKKLLERLEAQLKARKAGGGE